MVFKINSKSLVDIKSCFRTLFFNFDRYNFDPLKCPLVLFPKTNKPKDEKIVLLKHSKANKPN